MPLIFLTKIASLELLFVCSGNINNGEPGAVVANQAKSLEKNGIKVNFFLVEGKGFLGYLKTIQPLVKFIKNNNFTTIHSHYSLSAFVTTFALFFCKKSEIRHIVSLMGSDVHLSGWKRKLTRYFNKKHWETTIVKSEKMANDLALQNYKVIPNGVDLDLVKPSDNPQVNKGKTVLFAANPQRKVKNYQLAESAFQRIDKSIAELKVVYNLSHKDLISEINKADVILLTSLWEGSPNVIKEAMACNKPIVATNVGDVKWLINGLNGCFIVEHDDVKVARAVQHALNFSVTKGRERLINIGLSSDKIAQSIIQLYK